MNTNNILKHLFNNNNNITSNKAIHIRLRVENIIIGLAKQYLPSFINYLEDYKMRLKQVRMN